jgi:hypothetical protein
MFALVTPLPAVGITLAVAGGQLLRQPPVQLAAVYRVRPFTPVRKGEPPPDEASSVVAIPLMVVPVPEP